MQVTPLAGRLWVSVLGDMTATLDGELVDLGGRRQRAVLAVLVQHRGDIVPTDRLIDCVWGGRPPANAAGALQAYISHLRRRLEPGATARARGNVIVSRPPGYALNLDPEAVDAWRFERGITAALGTGGTGGTGGSGHPGHAGQDAAAQRDLLEAALRLWQGPAYAEVRRRAVGAGRGGPARGAARGRPGAAARGAARARRQRAAGAGAGAARRGGAAARAALAAAGARAVPGAPAG